MHRLESPCVQSELPWRGNRFSTPVMKCCFPGKSFTALETEPHCLLALGLRHLLKHSSKILHSFYQSSVHVAAATAPNGKHRQTDGRTHTHPHCRGGRCPGRDSRGLPHGWREAVVLFTTSVAISSLIGGNLVDFAHSLLLALWREPSPPSRT